MQPFKIGLIQASYRSSFKESLPEIARFSSYKAEMTEEDFDFNLQRFVNLAREAASRGADMVLSSESILDGWSADYQTAKRSAVSMRSREVEVLATTAGQAGIWMCAALFVQEKGALYNSALLFGPDGGVQGTYRKTHETKDVLERIPYCLGNELPVFGTAHGTLAILICHDRWYPESARALRRKGAGIILNPVAAGVYSPYHRYQEIHRCVLRTQAYVNGVFWASCNSANHGGHSVVAAPDGTIVAEASAREEVLIATIDPDEFDSYDFVANVRPEIYR